MRGKAYDFKFTVEGRGIFPLDMLRYDRCFPRSEQDAVIAQEGRGTLRKVTLSACNRDRHWMPTEGRWSSFNWTVVSAELVE